MTTKFSKSEIKSIRAIADTIDRANDSGETGHLHPYDSDTLRELADRLEANRQSPSVAPNDDWLEEKVTKIYLEPYGHYDDVDISDESLMSHEEVIHFAMAVVQQLARTEASSESPSQAPTDEEWEMLMDKVNDRFEREWGPAPSDPDKRKNFVFAEQWFLRGASKMLQVVQDSTKADKLTPDSESTKFKRLGPKEQYVEDRLRESIQELEKRLQWYESRATAIAAEEDRIKELETENAKLKDVLEKIADPRKRDHSEPDVYTKYGCVMHMAQEALEAKGDGRE